MSSHSILSSRTFISALLAGTLDILAAFIQQYSKTGRNPLPVLTFIASGVFGRKAFEGGGEMLALGLIFHFLIALIFTIILFQAFRRFPALGRYRFITGIVYGVFIWAVMQFIVLPLSNTPPLKLTLARSIPSILILIACMGLPLALLAPREKPVKADFRID